MNIVGKQTKKLLDKVFRIKILLYLYDDFCMIFMKIIKGYDLYSCNIRVTYNTIFTPSYTKEKCCFKALFSLIKLY